MTRTLKKKKRIGLLTGGGDCPGLNAVIRAVVKTCTRTFDIDVFGFEEGFVGLVNNRIRQLYYDDVSKILTEGGTILGTCRDHLFNMKGPEGIPSHDKQLRSAQRTMKNNQLDSIICIGGDGSLSVGHKLHQQGIPVIGVPKTIDNDVHSTDQTFGFDTAITVATNAIDRLRSTAASHRRVMIVETMGRSAGWIALHAGLAGGGDIILLPEIPFSLDTVCKVIEKRFKSGRKYSIIVIAEGAADDHGLVTQSSEHKIVSGISIQLASYIQKNTGIESRATILGHIQRGGTPTPFDRVLATRYGHKAAELAAHGITGTMVALKNGLIEFVALGQVAGAPKRVTLDCALLKAAAEVGTSFGVAHR